MFRMSDGTRVLKVMMMIDWPVDCSGGTFGEPTLLAREGICGLGLLAEPGNGLPVVFVWLIGDPRRQRHVEVTAECFSVSLVENAHFSQPVAGEVVTANAESALAERVIEVSILLLGKPVGSIRDRLQAENLGQIDQGVTGHRERELSLARFLIADAGDQQRRCVEDGGKGAEPALI